MSAQQRARRRQAFLQSHPACIFCGGGVAATTIEHCPPRALFQYRHWPVGFEFPACNSCNLGTGDYDLLVSMVARFDPIELKGNTDGSMRGLMQNVHRQYPGLYEEIIQTPREARRANRELGIKPAPGQTHQMAAGLKIPDRLHHAVSVFACKLTKAVYYRETGSFFSSDGGVMFCWFTNADRRKDGSYPDFDLLKAMGGVAPILERSGRRLNSQFNYKVSLDANLGLIALQALLGHSFGFVSFGCAVQGKLEETIASMQKKTGLQGPFSILQSASMQLGPLNPPDGGLGPTKTAVI